ncbi:MAG: TatD family hydrolase [bacterium]
MTSPLIDTHAHLNLADFDIDRERIITQAQRADMKIVNIGADLESSRGALVLAEKHQGLYATIGIHPEVVGDYLGQEDKLGADLSGLAKLTGINLVAIGEIGLDYFRAKDQKVEVKELQKKILLYQLDLALEKNLPVVLHCRASNGSNEAYSDLLNILALPKYNSLIGVVHCFGSTIEMANKFIALGFLIGVTGIVTFKNKSKELQELVRQIPLDKLLMETDCPYLAPEPYRGGRNEPQYVLAVGQKIAEVKQLSLESVITQLNCNAQKLFAI